MKKQTILKTLLIFTVLFVDLMIADFLLGLLSEPDTLINFIGFIGFPILIIINFITFKKFSK